MVTETFRVEHVEFWQFTEWLAPDDPDLSAWLSHFERCRSVHRVISRDGLVAIFRPTAQPEERPRERDPFVDGWKVGKAGKSIVLLHRSGHTIAYERGVPGWEFARGIPETTRKARRSDIEAVNGACGRLIATCF